MVNAAVIFMVSIYRLRIPIGLAPRVPHSFGEHYRLRFTRVWNRFQAGRVILRSKDILDSDRILMRLEEEGWPLSVVQQHLCIFFYEIRGFP